MKKCILSMVALLSLSISAWGQAYGVCLAQDETSLYVSAPESSSFVVMDKATGRMDFYTEENSNLDLEGGFILFNGLVAKDGIVWMTLGNSRRGHFADGRFSVDASLADSQYNLSRLTAAPSGDFWAASAGSVYHLSSDMSKVDKYSISGNKVDISSIRAVVPAGDGSVWLYGSIQDVTGAERRSPLFRLSEGRFTYYPETRSKGILHVTSDAAGEAVCALRDGSIAKFNGHRMETVATGIPSEVLDNDIADMKYDDAGRLWILSSRNVITCLDGEEFKVYALPHQEYDNRLVSLSLCGRDVYAVAYRLVHIINPETGLADGYGARHARAIVYGIKDGKVEMTEIVPSAGDTNAVSNVEVAEAAPAAMYDLQGRRLTEEPAKGVYIQNGKKVVK